ncbi:MAG: hypothetical protein WBL74_02595 [Novosphingobium sp.]|uniref:hypothetical protein n=1 Tax=Novosphingobium sp. TaxID=1874826 RepID=UPI003C79E1C2
MTTSHGFNRRSLLQMAAALPLAGAALYGTGLIGAGAALASTKQIPGIGIRVKKSPGGPTSRVRAVASDGAGRFSVTVAEAGNQSVDIDKAALQMAVNAQAHIYGPGTTAERLVVVSFARGLRVTGPGGQSAVPGHPGTFILSSGTQTFIVSNMAAGSVIAGTVETVDLGDLFPGAAAKGIKDQGVKTCGSCGLTGRMVAEPMTPMAPMVVPRPRG